MERLDAFSDFTDKGYSEMVYTDDIVETRKAQLSDAALWLREKGVIKYRMAASDGTELIAAAFIQDDAEAPWAILLHGYTGWKEELYQHAYRFYLEGYSVLVPDLRAQGESGGRYIGLGVLDRSDLLDWLRALQSNFSCRDIVLYGQSMGGSAAIMLAASPELPENVRAVVSDCAFCDAAALFKRKVRDWTGLPSFGLIDTAGLLMKPQAGYFLSEASALRAAPDVRVPVLFIHGSEDLMVPASDMEKLFEACGSEKKDSLLIEGAGHAQSAEKDPERYYGAVFGFLREALGGREDGE
ncbi:MAG: alpha/beta hydrolase [Firmicutes bacterium]|nr:alpha/beta hydrolase [Bacillota bacterium]